MAAAHMRVAIGARDVGMPQHLLNNPQIRPMIK